MFFAGLPSLKVAPIYSLGFYSPRLLLFKLLINYCEMEGAKLKIALGNDKNAS